MKVRLCQILSDLSNYSNNTIMDLSDRYQVTERTIRNDIESINDFLRENNQDSIEISRTGRIRCDMEMNTLKELLSSLDLYQYKLSHIERRMLLSYILLMSKRSARVSDLASVLRVSRSTINNDLEELKIEFQNYGLSIEAYSNKGLYVVGTEEQKREFLLYIKAFDLVLRDHLLNHIDREYFEISDYFIVQNRSLIRLIKEQLEHFNYKLSDFYLDHVVDYCELLVRRNKENIYIERNDEPFTGQAKVKRFSDSIYDHLTNYFEIERSSSEEGALNRFLRKIPLDNEIAESEYSIQIQVLTKKFIGCISEDLCMNLNDDFDFYESLSKHLDLIQMEEKLFTEINPFIEQIVGRNTAILEAVRANIAEYESFINRQLSKDEIYYIVIHICAALERKQNQRLNLDAVLVGNEETGSLKLLKEKLKNHFDFRSIEIQDKYSLNFRENTVVITTVPITLPSVDYVKVSPFLTDEDLIRIGRRIENIRKAGNGEYVLPENPASSSSALIKDINRIILTENDVYSSVNKVNEALAEYFKISMSTNPRLYELLSLENMIELDVVVQSLEEGIRRSGNSLVKAGIIESPYIESCLDAARNHSSCLLIGEEFLLAHSDVSEANKKVGFSLIRLKTPYSFGEGEKIKWICTMSAVNRSDHLRALFILTNLIQDQDYRRLLDQAESVEEIQEIVKRYEYLEHPMSVY